MALRNAAVSGYSAGDIPPSPSVASIASGIEMFFIDHNIAHKASTRCRSISAYAAYPLKPLLFHQRYWQRHEEQRQQYYRHWLTFPHHDPRIPADDQRFRRRYQHHCHRPAQRRNVTPTSELGAGLPRPSSPDRARLRTNREQSKIASAKAQSINTQQWRYRTAGRFVHKQSQPAQHPVNFVPPHQQAAGGRQRRAPSSQPQRYPPDKRKGLQFCDAATLLRRLSSPILLAFNEICGC